MANVKSNDSIEKTIESASFAVESAASASSASDKPDEKFRDLAEKQVEHVNDIARSEPVGSEALRNADDASRRSKTRVGGAVQTLLSTLAKLPLDDFRNNYDEPNKYREFLEHKFGVRQHIMECLVGSVANALELRKDWKEFEESLEAGHASLGAVGSPSFIPLGGQCTKSDTEFVAANNALAMAKVPPHYTTDVHFSLSAGEYIGYAMPIVCTYVVLWATCGLFRSGSFSKLRDYAYTTTNSALQRYLELPWGGAVGVEQAIKPRKSR